MEKPSYTPKPMMLYVSKVSEADAEHFGTQVEMIVDVQMSEIDAKRLRDMLTEKLNVEVYGALSFRLKGRLIL